jgi:deoxyadenosine/deoxycytidine kinase
MASDGISPDKRFVAIAGNIGVGKSSLTGLLSQRLGWEPFYEAVAENPYLADFYQDMTRYAFHSQIFFLSRRLRHHRRLLDFPGSVMQDRSVYEDAEVFACALYRQGHIAARDYRTYRELYEVLVQFLPPPDLVVYLRASVTTLLKRIALRGRNFEQNVAPSYIQQLNDLYEEWMSSFTQCRVLIVPSDDLDFVHNAGDLDRIVARIMAQLRGQEAVGTW